ncbi:Oligopeptide transport ATP-binding protein OppF [Planctomycetes bacterium Pla163]|uniref:Oligopeptide transport ATP-binding protein OppF n=1 Tax=Rohdeia mirabilis TaxID=2528008 RepID=A0A518CY68_9BACT|nr:Oligopeptide transport ATP-binding protein OppF [Planctomycetes bacterium Pla163]
MSLTSPTPTRTETLLSIRGLKVHFPVYGGVLRRKVGAVKAVDGIDLEVRRGETIGLVGESGSGKTTVGRAIINVLKPMYPDVELDGSIEVHSRDGLVQDVNGLGRARMNAFRPKIQMVFQDPFSSLNPRMTVAQLIGRPLELHTKLTRDERRERVESLLERVGLQRSYAERFPHEFSGGQRQRIGIARALSTRPEIIVADEPVSALDVSVQAQVVNLMQELARDFDLSYVFIAHDLSIVYHISDRIAVMYLGNVVEIGSAEQVYMRPRHPYTRALVSAVPHPDPKQRGRQRIRLEGDIPTPMNKPSGCGFRTRCPIAKASCADLPPEVQTVEVGHTVACPHWREMQ